MRPRILLVTAVAILASAFLTTGCASGGPAGAPHGGKAAGSGGPDAFWVAGGGLGNDIPAGSALTLGKLSVDASGGGIRRPRPGEATPATPPPPTPPTTITVFGDSGVGKDWRLRLNAAVGHNLAPGSYTGAAAEPPTDVPTVDIFGDGHACTVASATFTVYEDDMDATGHLTDLNLTFDIKCQTNPVDDPTLVGYVRYHATRPTPVPAIPTWSSPLGPPSSAQPVEFATRTPGT